MVNLKAAIALLPDRALGNRMAAAALVAHGVTGGRLRWPRLPAHLSLAQPFAIDSVASVERCFEQIAKQAAPIEVTLGTLEIQPPSSNSPESVVWVGVRDCPQLLELHLRLERELAEAQSAGVASAPFDGAIHRFHLTLGFLPAANLTSREQLPEFAGSAATFSEIALFLYDGLPRAGWQCMLYARRPLGSFER